MVTRVPESTQDEMEAAVASCKRAFDDWSQTTILTRQQMMFKLQNLVRENLVTAISVILGNIELSLKFLNSLEIVLHVPVIMFHYGYLNVFKNTSQSFIKPLNNSKSVYRVYCLVMVIKKRAVDHLFDLNYFYVAIFICRRFPQVLETLYYHMYTYVFSYFAFSIVVGHSQKHYQRAREDPGGC